MYIELPWIDTRSSGNAVFAIRSISCSIVIIRLYKVALNQTTDKIEYIHKYLNDIAN